MIFVSFGILGFSSKKIVPSSLKIRNKVSYLKHNNQITITRKLSLQLNNPSGNKQFDVTLTGRRSLKHPGLNRRPFNMQSKALPLSYIPVQVAPWLLKIPNNTNTTINIINTTINNSTQFSPM